MKGMRSSAAGAAVLASVLVLALAGVAWAEAIGISPAGAVTASSGSVTFTSSSGNVICAMTLSGTLEADAQGTLSEAPRPEVNPRIGSLTEGRVSAGSCSGGRITPLTGGAASVYVKAVSASGEEEETVEAYVEHMTLLVEKTGIGNCLYEARMSLSYSNGSGSAPIAGLSEVRSRLLSGICPAGAGLRGTLAVAPRQKIVKRVWECDESGRVVRDGVRFAVTAPGRTDVRELICKNVSGGALRIAAGSGIIGAEAAKFRAENIPGVGAEIANGASRTITLTFQPPAETPRGGTFIADFKLVTEARNEHFVLRGST